MARYFFEITTPQTRAPSGNDVNEERRTGPSTRQLATQRHLLMDAFFRVWQHARDGRNAAHSVFIVAAAPRDITQTPARSSDRKEARRMNEKRLHFRSGSDVSLSRVTRTPVARLSRYKISRAEKKEVARVPEPRRRRRVTRKKL